MDKWILVSNLQKAIRRNQEEIAVKTSTELWKIDNAYLRYRTAVILVEDIGIANINLLSMAFEGKLGKRWIDAKGGLSWFLDNIIIPAARSTKDRTACDLGIISKNNKPQFEEKYGLFQNISIDTAVDIYTNSASILEKGLAAWRIAGTDLFPHKSLPEQIKGDWQKWLNINKDLGVSDNTLNIMKLAQKSQREWHAIYLGIAEINSKLHTIKQESIETPIYENIILAAADIHTRIGQNAIRNYIKTNNTLKSELEKLNCILNYTEIEKAISKMIFLLEGGKINSGLTYPLASEVDKIQKQQWMEYHKLPGNKIASIIWNTRDNLNNFRKIEIDKIIQLENSHDINDMSI